MVCTTASASLSSGLYVEGFKISAFSQKTEDDHGGAVEEEVTELHVGSPERLGVTSASAGVIQASLSYLIEVTSHPLVTADLHILEPDVEVSLRHHTWGQRAVHLGIHSLHKLQSSSAQS